LRHQTGMTKPPRLTLIKPTFILALLCIVQLAFGQVTEIRGRVIDAGSKQPLSFVNVILKNRITLSGVTTDDDGNFTIRSSERADSIRISSIGYQTRIVPVQRGVYQEMTIELALKGSELRPVVINAPRRHMRYQIDSPTKYVYDQVVAHKKYNKEENLTNYSLQEYQKLQMGVINPRSWFLKLRILRPFLFVLNNRDTTAEDSTVYIPGLLKEDLVDVYYRKNPKSVRRVTQATKFTGIDNNSLGDLVNYTFDRVNVYDEVYVLLNKSFVSPFANGARHTTYEYWLRDTLRENGRTLYKISFVGISKVDLALKGYAWIDSGTWAIKSIYFRPNEHANMNYIKDYSIRQSFKLVDGKTWILETEDVTSVGTLLKKPKAQMAIIVKKHLSRKDIKINQPLDDTLFRGAEKEIFVEGAHFKSREWWDQMRYDSLTSHERELIKIHDTLKTVPAYKRIFWTAKLLSTAYFQAGPLDFGRFYKFVSKNNVEGVRLRMGINTNQNFSKTVNFFTYGAYGLKDHDFKYNVTGHFRIPSSNDKWSQLEIYYQYDINVLGQQNELLTFDNAITLLRGSLLTKIMKIREWNANLENEWVRGFTSTMFVQNRTYYDIPGVFDFKIRKQDGSIVHLPNFNTFEVGINSRFSYHDKYFKSGSYRYFITTKSPVFHFNYHIGMLDINGDRSTYHRVQFTILHRLAWTLGHTWYEVKVGKVIGRSPYPISNVTPGGFGPLFNNADYNMLSEFEFVTDQYLSWYLEHHFDGYFLNKIPLIRRLQMREVLYTRGLWGSYSQSNFNSLIPGFDFKSPSAYPYVEAGFGIENILKVLRFDSVWRLTYRNQHIAPNWSPKISFNFVF